ncbi:MAG: nitroreductase family protein [Planctomycetota bacterium]
MDKVARTAQPVHELIANRWSPRAFTEESVTREQVHSLLEAARWAPSCYNNQPWRYIVARKEDEEGFERLASCLVDGNSWAKEAAVLMLSVAKQTFDHNDKPNRHAFHDVGLASENLVLQAEALGLSTHQMAGFQVDRAREVLGIPEGYDPVAMIAIGHRGDPDGLPDNLKERELSKRERKPLEEIGFGSKWGEAL